MIDKPTVLILGAGASQEYGLPCGFQFYQHIVEWCSAAQVEVNYIATLKKLQIEPTLASEFAKTLGRCTSESIDDLLATRPNFRQIGKAAIAMRLLGSESMEMLTRVQDRPKLWYPYLINCSKGRNHIDLINNKITIVTFNYDRSIEQFYRLALEHNHACSPEMSSSLMASVRIIHLHGSLGALEENPYGAPSTSTNLERAIKGIKTIDEVIDTAHRSAFEVAREAIQSADKIIILGFGFHTTNLERLRLKESHAQIWATCYGMSDGQRTAASSLIGRHVVWADPTETIRQFLQRENCLLC